VVYTRWSTGSENTRYLTADHLNSSSVLMDSSGNALVSMSFAAYGRRRGSGWSGNPSSGDWSQINNATRHGFTGHEHLDNVNLIHMNGRVFEPVLGRFLSADPFIDGIGTSQGPNRYGYVHGKPVSFIDPSGFNCDPPPGMPEEEAGAYISRCSDAFESAGWGAIYENERWCAALDMNCQRVVMEQKMSEHAYVQSIFLDMRGGASRPLPNGTVELPEGTLCMISAEKSAAQCIAEFGSGQNLATGVAAGIAATEGAAEASRRTNQYGWANLDDESHMRAGKILRELLTELNRFDTIVDVVEVGAIVVRDGLTNTAVFKSTDVAIGGIFFATGPVLGTGLNVAFAAAGGSRGMSEAMLKHFQQCVELRMMCEPIK
jgi:RHS repeat-associated protein